MPGRKMQNIFAKVFAGLIRRRFGGGKKAYTRKWYSPPFAQIKFELTAI
jgi:hypothetical protein